MDRERKAAAKAEAKQRSPPKKEEKKTKEEDALGGFDLDSVLASTSTGTSGPGGAGPSGRKSSVVATDAAQEMDRMSAQEAPTSSLPASIGQQRRSSPPSTSNVGQSTQEAEKQPTVRRRKAVKKARSAAPESESIDEAPAATYDDEEEFSDFSF